MKAIAAGRTLAVLLSAGMPAGASEEPALDAFLSRWAQLTPAERRSVEEGRVVAKMLEVSDAKDIASVTVVKLAVPKARLVRWLTSVEERRGDSVIAAGEVAPAGDTRDVAGLTVAERQAEDLRDCRPGACGMKLPADAIGELRAVSAAKGVTAEAASRVLRDVVTRAADAYRRLGTAGLVTYADRPRPVPVGDALQGLLASVPGLLSDLSAQGLGLPSPGAAGGRFVWSQEKLWKRIVITLDHEVFQEPSPSDAVLFSVRLFANHYFEGSFSVTAVHETLAGCYVVYLNRSRSDHRDGGFSGLERSLVNLLVRRRLRAQWQDARARVESWRRAGP